MRATALHRSRRVHEQIARNPLIVAFASSLELGAGLYYMRYRTTKRTVNALTRRIALSVALILLVASPSMG